jgi:hypothetical protein
MRGIAQPLHDDQTTTLRKSLLIYQKNSNSGSSKFLPFDAVLSKPIESVIYVIVLVTNKRSINIIILIMG